MVPPFYSNGFKEYLPGIRIFLKNGNTIEGIEEGSRWKCEYNVSLIEPKRNVIAIKY